MKRIVLAIGLVVAAGATCAAERLPNFPKNTPYENARSSLIALGWQPVRLPDAEPARVNSDDPRYRGHPEVVSCAGTGAGNCNFAWRRNDTLIEVGTIYDMIPTVAGVRCRAGCR